MIDASGRLGGGGSIGMVFLDFLLPPKPPAFCTNVMDWLKATFFPTSLNVSTGKEIEDHFNSGCQHRIKPGVDNVPKMEHTFQTSLL